jgi:hypothetical protein
MRDYLPPPPLTSVPIDAQLLLTSTHRRSNCSRPLLSSPLHANSLLSSYGSCHVVPLRLLPYHHHSPPSGHPSPLRLHVICLDAQLNRSCHPPLLLTSLWRLLPSFFPLCGSSHVVPLRLLPYAPPPFAPLCAPSATFATTPTTPTRNLRSTAPATPPRLFPLVSSSHHRGLLTTELNSSAAYASPNAIPDTTTALLSSTAYVHLLDLLPRHDPHRCCMTPLSAV